jgi:hypothetical protein
MGELPRRLTAEEAAVLGWLLEHGSVVGPLQHLTSGLDSLRVVAVCGCGCPSVDFALPDPDHKGRVLAEGFGTLENGEEVGLIAWGRGDAVIGLEAYKYGDHAHPFALPAVQSLQSEGAA